MPRKSPQARYQSALRVIKSRTRVTHKTAQAIYRLQRDRAGEVAKFPTFYKRQLRAAEIRAAADLAIGAVQRTLFRQADSENKQGDFSFDVRDLHDDMIMRRLSTTERAHITLMVTLSIFRRGTLVDTRTVARLVPTNPADFWPAYYDMCREALADFYTDGQGGDVPVSIVTDAITFVE